MVRLVSGLGSGSTRAARHWWGGLNPEGGIQKATAGYSLFDPLGCDGCRHEIEGTIFNRGSVDWPLPLYAAVPSPRQLGSVMLDKHSPNIGEPHRAWAF